jgi:hypothetical protein
MKTKKLKKKEVLESTPVPNWKEEAKVLFSHDFKEQKVNET